MSAKIMGQVWELDLPMNEQAVLLAMADHADADGYKVFPSLGLIAWKVGCSVNTVRRMKENLEKKGLLVKVKEPHGWPSIYRIVISSGKMKPPFEKRKSVTPPNLGNNPSQFGTSEHLTPPNLALNPSQSSGTLTIEPSLGEPSKKNSINLSVLIPQELDTPHFQEKWATWVKVRMAMKKCKDFGILFAEQIEMLKNYSPDVAAGILSNSIMNNYQGIHPPKPNGYQNGRYNGGGYTNGSSFEDRESRKTLREIEGIKIPPAMGRTVQSNILLKFDKTLLEDSPQ